MRRSLLAWRYRLRQILCGGEGPRCDVASSHGWPSRVDVGRLIGWRREGCLTRWCALSTVSTRRTSPTSWWVAFFPARFGTGLSAVNRLELMPHLGEHLVDWIARCDRRDEERKSTRAICMLGLWEIWKHRNK